LHGDSMHLVELSDHRSRFGGSWPANSAADTIISKVPTTNDNRIPTITSRSRLMPIIYGRGTGVGRGLGVGVNLGVVSGNGVGVAVAVGLGVGVA